MNYFCKAFDDDDRLCMTDDNITAETPEAAALLMAEMLEEDPEGYAGDPTTPWWKLLVYPNTVPATRVLYRFRVTRIRSVTHKVEVLAL